ncbi:L,D-transpeptidase family protein [Rhizobium alarense]|uniref:L,D-transpeptidase family protein n=1 Tax=Rhizobium alarense TaxID=2846851 RepID=UPI0038B43F67
MGTIDIFSIRHRLARRGGVARALAAGLLIATMLSGCMSSGLEDLANTVPPLSSKVKAEMARKGMTPESPVLVRIFKQESELEIWKRDKSGRYALFKTYPMCRWSGKLGPKTQTGDRQAPEGFYHVSASMLNPKSQYYLSFNLGYPNRLESALGYTGDALMVHGACSSSGCYAVTDQGIAEIYPVVQAALAGGQRQFQVQALPFRMTAANMARYRGSEHFAFWKTLKEGSDSFELVRQPPKVSVCSGRYMFNAEFDGGEPADPLAACPARLNQTDPRLVAEVQKLDALSAGSQSALMYSYVDGGMHPSFRALLEKQGAKALAAKTSRTKYPISRPDAALADPYEN